jgi:drug/metabolite transporter (DMT)-like permease
MLLMWIFLSIFSAGSIGATIMLATAIAFPKSKRNIRLSVLGCFIGIGLSQLIIFLLERQSFDSFLKDRTTPTSLGVALAMGCFFTIVALQLWIVMLRKDQKNNLDSHDRSL